MKIAFYAPLKSPDHPVPSGDRLMARLLIEALRRSGHEVEIVSEFRSFSATPDALSRLQQEAGGEIERIDAEWRRDGVPDLWFCYHPYYKSPDLLGPTLCRAHGVAYVTAEASYSQRRNGQGWQAHQNLLANALQFAAVNIGLTRRDLEGIRQSVTTARLEHLPPFIDTAAFSARAHEPKPLHLVTVAMMRPGDKLSSYTALAAALQPLDDLPWRLSIVGDGPAHDDVKTLFAGFGSCRILWHGQLSADEVAGVLASGAVYLWPGHGEAYGLAYLEAQAAGLPVVAERIAGVPEVVEDGRTGILTVPGDTEAYSAAIRQLLTNDDARKAMAGAARDFVLAERSLDGAARRLETILETHLEFLR
ncbi:glycosyltransferase involved in cell wall biosynthesis [Neorhizobium huautlense]|uniref:Glycosyltransferase involved in cell wall biosynthesis n=1 Tax=Neorhizobium huautlense TaxID=67774 RepID=A0ABT9Q0T8_9HYPH|nr:glycosyltransferase family 4 protein [Neorhizobium huautlense]MDP9840345.1 glycosyltransferase involved in cell wall biosynthesis [Neorhizobium huautlense]